MAELINAAEMTGEQKIEFLETQILRIRAKDLDWILCPYCGGENYPTNEFLCCPLFKEATEAIMSRLEQKDALDFSRNIADRAFESATKRHVN